MDGYEDAPPTRSTARVPPHSREAEESVLGAMLLSVDAANEVMDRLGGEDFYVPAHQSIFEAMRRLYDGNQAIDAVTLSEELRRAGELDKIGGVPYLTRLVDVVPVASNVDYYASIVEDNARRRDLIRAGSSVNSLAFELDEEIHAVMDRAEQAVLSVAERRVSQNLIEVGPLFQNALEEIELLESQGSEITGLATGFRDLDKKLAGLQNANLVIIAARPAMGKCLAGGTMLTDAKTGERFSIQDLVEEPERHGTVHLHALDQATMQLVTVAPTDFLDQGRAETFRLTTRTGRSIEATAGHPFLTLDGWRRLEELSVGDAVAVPNEIGSSGVDRIGDSTWDPIVSIESAGTQRVFDLTIPGPHNFVANDIVVHNSALTLNIATNVATGGKPVAVFSLEMSKEEIVQRILSSVGRVDSMKLRTGQLGPLWQRVVDAASRMYRAPIFIDDSPVVTITDIRAKCRRLKRAHGLSLVIVDYIQLMEGGNRENRQQEIAEISRNLKNLARELDVPVIGLSQLNRSLEAREDKRPRLSDLRESGCLTADTLLVRADTNREVTLGELVESGARDVPVWSLDERFRVVPANLTHAFPSGTKPVFDLELASGRVVRGSANHPFLTLEGWRRLDQLAEGDRIAVARALEPGSRETVDRVRSVLERRDSGTNVDTIPREIWEHIRYKAMPAAGITTRELARRLGMSSCGSTLYQSGVSRRRLGRLAEILGDRYLADLATSDVLWDRVVRVVPRGEAPVFDATVEGTHNFLANGIVAHNSIEQDADVVMFIYRHEYYHPEDQENKGLAEIVVAKHRAGSTGAVKMTFLPEFTRFADLGRDVT